MYTSHHISTRDAQKHVFYKTPFHHQQNYTAHRPVTLTTNILLSDVSPPLPFTNINQFLTPVTTETYVLPQHIIGVNWCKSGTEYIELYGWDCNWREIRNMTNVRSDS